MTDRWFYIRFRDPDPHIRIRFHGYAETLNGRLLPLLHDWATATCDSGLIRKMSLDTYEPEQERYGGHEALEAAERAFAADSEATVRQLVLMREGSVELDPLLVAAAGCLDICLRLSEGDEWQDWFLDSYPKGRHHSAFQERRGQAVRLLDPTGRWQNLAAEPGGERVLATWEERAPALRLYGKALRGGLFSGVDERLVGAYRSVLHMHCNRFLGIDPEREQAVYSIARGAVAAFRDRSRAGR
jgi:thiopeptide-type bacteriocin biosynthesis protein